MTTDIRDQLQAALGGAYAGAGQGARAVALAAELERGWPGDLVRDRELER